MDREANGEGTRATSVAWKSDAPAGKASASAQKLPEELLWLSGYFKHLDNPELDPSRRVDHGWRKNVDFLRLRDVALHLLDPGPGKTILDIGCANGATMVYCGLQGAKVYGQDLDPKMVKGANELCRRFGVDGQASVGDATELTFPDNHFDAVISSDFMEHITDDVKVKVLADARRVLKPGGLLITKTPNLAYLKLSLLQKRIWALLRGENPLQYMIPHTPGTDDPQHVGLTTRWTFTKCLTDAGFMNYQFFYAPLRRFGHSRVVEVLSTEIPVIRDLLCEEVFCRAYKPIVASHFPD